MPGSSKIWSRAGAGRRRRPWRTRRRPAPELLENRTLLTALDVVSSFLIEKDAAVWGDTVTVDYTVANRGTLPSASFSAPLMLSPGNRFSSSAVDQVLASVTVPALGPGQATPRTSLTVQLPGAPGLPPTGFPEPGNVFLGLELPGNSPSPEHGNDWEALPLLVPGTVSKPDNSLADVSAGPSLPLNSLVRATLTAGDLSSDERVLSGDNVNFFKLQVTAPDGNGRLLARVPDSPFPVRLSLYDRYGNVLVRSDGGPGLGDAVLDQHVRADEASGGGGTYFLSVEGLNGATGAYTLTTEFQQANLPGEDAPEAGLNHSDPSTGQLLTGIVTADFNGDGIPDLANVSNQANRVSVLLGVGDGTFRNEITSPTGRHPTALVTGDFNGDGVADLAVVNSGDNTVSILLGNNDGTFQPGPQTPAVGTKPVALVTGDFNGDGKTDLAVLNQADSTLSLLSGHGDGTFGVAGTVPVAMLPGELLTALIAGDFNNDGHPDLAVTVGGSVGQVAVFLNQSGGAFHEATTPANRPPAGGQPVAIVAGDFDDDGKLDVATASATDQVVTIFRGQGDGTFDTPRQVALTPGGQPEAGLQARDLLVGDFNGDGKVDLAVSLDSGRAQDPGRALVLVGQGDGTFHSADQLLTTGWPGPLAAGDFDGDGRLDLASLSSDPNLHASGVLVLPGRGDGTFQESTPFLTDLNPVAVVGGDLNGDGNPDLVTANRDGNDVSVLPGLGDGTLDTEKRFAVGVGPRALVLGDFNSDGRLDLAVADSGSNASTPNGTGDVRILLGLGDGSFATFQEATYVMGKAPSALVVGDFNDDGVPDLAVANSGDNTVSILLGNGDGTFRPGPQTPAVGSDPVALVAGHFDGDAYLDLAVADEGSNDVTVLHGKGDGTFQPGVRVGVGAAPDALVAGHFTADSYLDDLAVANHDPLAGNRFATILLSHTDGTMDRSDVPTTGLGGVSIVAGNFLSGNGAQDLAILYDGEGQESPELFYLQGDGQGNFTAPPSDSINVPGAPLALAVVDLNRDGRPDLAVTEGAGDKIQVFLGRGDADDLFDAPGVSTPSLVQAAPVMMDVNGDGVLDAVVLDYTGTLLVRLGLPHRPGVFGLLVLVNPQTPARAFTTLHVGSQVLLGATSEVGDVVSLYRISLDGTPSLVTSFHSGALLPARIVAGDLNGDGRDDLAVLDAFRGEVDFFFANDHGGFDPVGTYNVGPGVADLALGDIDGNGTRDVVVTSAVSGEVSIRVNDPENSFLPALEEYRAGRAAAGVDDLNPLDVVSGEGTNGVVTGDFNGDGRSDVLVADVSAHRLALLLGDRFGGLAQPLVLPLDFTPGALAVGHFDTRQDDYLDVAVLDQTDGTIRIFLGDGQGHFTEKRNVDGNGQVVPLLAGDLATGLATQDVNGDGLDDLQVSNQFGDLVTLLGNGDGTFHPLFTQTPLVAGDLNGDGVPDAIVANQAANTVVAELRRPGTTQFTPATLPLAAQGLLGPSSIQLVDLNGDLLPDLIVTNGGSNTILVSLGQPGGTFAPAQTFSVGDNPASVTVADLNGDGLPDLVVSNQGSDDVSILLGQGTGNSWTLQPGPRLWSGHGPLGVAVRDVNNDGIPDLVVTNSQDGTFSALPGIGHNGTGTGFFHDLTPIVTAIPGNPVLQVDTGGFLVTTTGAVINSRTLQTVFVPPPGITVRFAAPAPTNLLVGGGGPGLFVTLSNGTVALLNEDLSGTFSESEVFSSSSLLDPSELTVVADGGQLDLYVSQEGDDVPVVFTLALGVPVAVPAPLLPGEPLISVLQPLPSAAVPVVPVLVQANQDLLLVADAVTTTTSPGLEGSSAVVDTASDTTTASTEGEEEAAGVSGDRTTGGDEGDLPDDTAAGNDPASLLDSVKQREQQASPPGPDDLLPPQDDQPPVEKRQSPSLSPALPVDLPASEAIGQRREEPHEDRIPAVRGEDTYQLEGMRWEVDGTEAWSRQVESVFVLATPGSETDESAGVAGLWGPWQERNGESAGTAPEILLTALLLAGAAVPVSDPDTAKEGQPVRGNRLAPALAGD